MDISTLVSPLASTQEAYEKIKKWFSQPGVEFGYDNDGQCVYRANQNEKSNIRCAIGCLIPDELYKELKDKHYGDAWIEGQGAEEAIDSSINMRNYFVNVNPSFLGDAQNVHDRCASNNSPIEKFLRELDNVAVRFGLTVIA